MSELVGPPQYSHAEKSPPSKEYKLRDNSRLENLVDGIVAEGTVHFLKPVELQGLADNIDAREIMDNLPPQVSQEDFIGILGLSLGTECATDTYARQFVSSSRKYDQPWLGRFTTKVWAPDEILHHLPFKQMLMQLGQSEEDLDQIIKDAQESDYLHKAGFSPAHLTTFGMVQEYLTRNWYQFTREVVRPSSPDAAKMVGRVEGREAVHTKWYRDMTSLQIEENPSLIKHVAETLARFEMPGNEIVPDLQSRASDWLSKMGADLDRLKTNVIELAIEAAGRPDKVGRLALEYASQQNMDIGPFKAGHVVASLNMLGGPGYGLVGEAVLSKIGLKEPFRDDGITDRIRGVFRNAIAERIDL